MGIQPDDTLASRSTQTTRVLLRSFGYAAAGVGYVLRTQRNARIHVLLAAAACGLAVWLRITRIEWALLAGIVAISTGFAVDAHILYVWLKTHGGTLDETVTHLAIVAGTLLAIGVEVIFSAFFLSILRASRMRKWT